MKRGRSTGKPTKAQQDYQDRARALGCVVCIWRIKHGYTHKQCGDTHIHHRNIGDFHGAKRMGQDFVVALGAWHHDGVPPRVGSDDETREVYGPSFKYAKDFRAWTDDVLPGYGRGTGAWQKYQDELLGESNV